MQEIWQQTFYHNTVLDWLIALAVAIAFVLLVKVFQIVVLSHLEKVAKRTGSDVDDIIVGTFKKTYTLIALIIGLAIGAYFLTLPSRVERFIHIAATVAIALQVALWLNALIAAYVTKLHEKKKAEDPASVSIMGALSFFLRLVLWSIILLIVLDNIGVNITTLVAGLGIGGIAVALAAQNILSDIFNSIVILVDKPFEVGDFITVGDLMGTVEKIGIKTTRVRSLNGEQLIFTNSDLIGSRIQNYKRMIERRVTFQVGVTYQTTAEQLQKIPAMIKDIIEATARTRFDRSHFKSFGGYSLDFETAYYVLSSDYNLYMDIQQEINLKVFRKFAAENVKFAYPTQTLLVGSEIRTVSVTPGSKNEADSQ